MGRSTRLSWGFKMLLTLYALTQRARFTLGRMQSSASTVTTIDNNVVTVSSIQTTAQPVTTVTAKVSQNA